MEMLCAAGERECGYSQSVIPTILLTRAEHSHSQLHVSPGPGRREAADHPPTSVTRRGQIMANAEAAISQCSLD